jgi:hypothetical protein
MLKMNLREAPNLFICQVRRDGGAALFKRHGKRRVLIDAFVIPVSIVTAKLCRVACIVPWDNGPSAGPGHGEGVSALQHSPL